MALVKISLLCLILYGCLREIESKDFYSAKRKKTSNDKIESKALSTSECYCIPKNPQGQRISDYISLNGVQQGRLVVYLFKNKNEKITIYVPNKEKQRFLPDLTLDVGDKIAPINKENVFDLYNIYSDLATSNINEPAWQKVPGGSSPSDIHFPPQALDPEVLKALIAKIKYYSLNSNDESKLDEILYSTPDRNLYLQLLAKYPSITSLLLPGDLTVLPSPSKTNGSLETSKKYPSINKLLLPGELTVFPIPLEITNTLNTSKIIQETHKIPSHIKPNAPEYLTIPNQYPPKVIDIPENMAIQNKPTQLYIHKGKDKTIVNVNPTPSQFIIQDDTKNNYDVPSSVQFQYKPTNPYQPSVSQNEIVQDGKYMYIIDGIKGEYIPYYDNSDAELNSQVIEGIMSSLPKPSSSPSLLTLTVPHLGKQIDNEIILSPSKENTGQKIFFVLPENELKDKINFEEWFQKQIEPIERQILFLSRKIDQSRLKILILEVLQNYGISVSNSGDLINSDGNTLDITKLKLLLTFVGDNFDYNQVVAGKKTIDSSSLRVIIVSLAKPPRILGIISLGKILEETTKATKPICNECERKKCKGIKCQNFIALEKDKLNILGKPKTNGESLLGTFLNSRLSDIESENGIIFEDKQSLKDIDVPEEVDIEVIEEDDDDLLGLRIIGGQPATSSGTPIASKGRSGYTY